MPTNNIKEGYFTDYISGLPVKETPEELEAVQPFSKILVDDYGYPKEFIHTRPQYRVKARPSDRRKEYPVDIAVFNSSVHDEKSIYIIVECKKKNRKDGRDQLEDYLRFSNASLGVWFNGEERLYLHKVIKDNEIQFREIPNIPRYGERLEDIGMFKRKDLRKAENLKPTFRAIRNYLAANAIGITRDEVFASQLINLIFCKIYAYKEDVQPGDILMVKDGTYLIGTNCIVTPLDIPMIYQSHILKFRVVSSELLDPLILFLALNCPLVQRQIRNMQFTADIIDTLGSRYREIILPIPKDITFRKELSEKMKQALDTRIRYKAAIKQMPLLIESVLESGTTQAFDTFFSKPIDEVLNELVQDTTTLEFGFFSAFRLNSSAITNGIYLPKYYDPAVENILRKLDGTCTRYSIQSLLNDKVIELATGDEIGKMAYGTGSIPFVRTSDFSNWEIKADAKQGVSEEIYEQYALKEDVRPGDILIVRDGTYLVGTSCLITEYDQKMLYCGGLIKIRVLKRIFLMNIFCLDF